MKKHTPAPWKFVTKEDKYGTEDLIVAQCDDKKSEVVCGAILNPVNGEFIVHAVNNHARLLASLKGMIDIFEEYVEDWDDDSIGMIALAAVKKIIAEAEAL